MDEQRSEPNAWQDGGPVSDGSASGEAVPETREGLRAVVGKAAQGVHDVTQTGGRWARRAEERALGMGRGLRGQGERAVDGVSRQVGQNPLASLATAFGFGFLCAMLLRRR